jgi:hypothetical protein
MVVEYQSLSPDMRVLSAIRFKEIKAEIEKRKYEGLTKPELYNTLNELNSGLSHKDADNSLKSLLDWGILQPFIRAEGKKRYRRTVIVSSVSRESGDEHLKLLGWLKENRELKI